ncbi:HNH endonuclease signature motif containing protein [Pseudomonas savastanoi]|uniref:HNH endonuclease signature motif containing protein n=1 Tax=Pseudomonas savastanoi TaxID=29438 RepID=UPI0018F3AAB2|nr:HNH endonuclease signature motif containing protein [Pseudomonas savastanoi]
MGDGSKYAKDTLQILINENLEFQETLAVATTGASAQAIAERLQATLKLTPEQTVDLGMIIASLAASNGGGSFRRVLAKASNRLEKSGEALVENHVDLSNPVIESGAQKARAPAKVDYSSIENPPNVGPGKDFTLRQKQEVLELNKAANDGVVRSDASGVELVRPQKSQCGVTPYPNEWQFYHVKPKSCDGSNCSSNLQILSLQENRAKSDNQRIIDE